MKEKENGAEINEDDNLEKKEFTQNKSGSSILSLLKPLQYLFVRNKPKCKFFSDLTLCPRSYFKNSLPALISLHAKCNWFLNIDIKHIQQTRPEKEI